jgi:hypothetical protein
MWLGLQGLVKGDTWAGAAVLVLVRGPVLFFFSLSTIHFSPDVLMSRLQFRLAHVSPQFMVSFQDVDMSI